MFLSRGLKPFNCALTVHRLLIVHPLDLQTSAKINIHCLVNGLFTILYTNELDG
jgi:hypothetical protein